MGVWSYIWKAEKRPRPPEPGFCASIQARAIRAGVAFLRSANVSSQSTNGAGL